MERKLKFPCAYIEKFELVLSTSGDIRPCQEKPQIEMPGTPEKQKSDQVVSERKK